MNAIIAWLNQVAANWSIIVFHSVWQSALVGVVVLAAVFWGRRWPAPVRYGLLLLALAKFAAPPLWPVSTGLFGVAGPAVVMTVSSRADREANHYARSSRPATENWIEPQLVQNAESYAYEPVKAWRAGPVAPIRNPPTHVLSTEAWLMLAHVAGTSAIGLWILGQLIRLRALARRGEVVRDEVLLRAWKSLGERLGMTRLPRLLVVPEACSPMACGVFSPAILLPRRFCERLELAEIEAILGHELAHVRRRDLWVNWVQLLLWAVWWFHPVLWLVNRALRRVREDCCDDLLLARGITSSNDYCGILVRAAGVLAAHQPVADALGCAEKLHPLGRRVVRLLDSRIPRWTRLSTAALFGAVLMAMLVLPGLRSQPIQTVNDKKDLLPNGKPGARLDLAGHSASPSSAGLITESKVSQGASAGTLVTAKPSRTSVFQIRLVREGTTTDSEEMHWFHKDGLSGPTLQDRYLVDEELVSQDHRRGVSSPASQDRLRVDKETLLDHTAIKCALPSSSPTSQPELEIIFTEKGRQLFAEITRQNIGKRLAILIDSEVLIAPTNWVEMTSGQLAISNSFTREAVIQLAREINQSLDRDRGQSGWSASSAAALYEDTRFVPTTASTMSITAYNFELPTLRPESSLEERISMKRLMVGMATHKLPANSHFNATEGGRCNIHGILHQFMDVTGIRFLVAKDVASGMVEFGHTNSMNGEQWVIAYTDALRNGQASWWNFQTHVLHRENLYLVTKDTGTVLVLPYKLLPEFQAKGFTNFVWRFAAEK